MQPKLSVKDLSAGYGQTTILNGISFEAPPAGFLGIIGPNGCGKTTLLRAISRTLRPSLGSVELDGRNVYEMHAREFARKVGVVPQDTAVAFEFTVLEVALMGRTPRLGRFAVESRADVEVAVAALTRTGTAHLATRPANALSGGERQRVVLARALAQEPEVMLLDEPTSHLDINYQFEIMDMVRKLNREAGLTVLAVLHDLNLASQYCDQLILLGNGGIQAAGTPEAVVTPENIHRVYGAMVWVRRHPTTHRPYVISGIKTTKHDERDQFERPFSVHVIGGGGAGAPIMARLIRRGFKVTCGVLVDGDADQEVADALDIPHICLPPFSVVNEQLHTDHIRLMQSAEMVVLADVPIGHGNLMNIRVALEAARSGKRVIVVRPESVVERDFTDGQGASVVNEIISLGAIPASTPEEVAKLVETTAGE